MSNVDPRQDIREAPSRDPAELEREADAARESIQRTIASLERRLSPGDMVDRAVGAWRRRTEGSDPFTANLFDTVRSNPIPVLVSSFGLAWLAASDRRGPAPSGGRKARSHTSEATGKASEVSGQVSETASDVAGRAASAASGARESARSAFSSVRGRASGSAGSLSDALSGQGTRAREGFSRMQEEQPFVLAAIGIAIGAALGGSMPASRAEQSVAGQYGDRMRAAAGETAEAAREQASEAAENVKRTAQEKAGTEREQGGTEHEPRGDRGAGHQGEGEQAQAKAAASRTSRSGSTKRSGSG